VDVEAVSTLVETYLLGRKDLRALKYMLFEDRIRSNWDRLEELRETCQNNGVSFEAIRAVTPFDKWMGMEAEHSQFFSTPHEMTSREGNSRKKRSKGSKCVIH
jgi:hypothetical protein